MDLQRHIDCPIWSDATEMTSENCTAQWSTSTTYTCQNVLHAYCKVFDQQELCDLMVRYYYNISMNINIANYE